MNIEDLKSGFDDVKILLNMENEIETGKIKTDNPDDAMQKLEYVKKRLLKIVIDNDKRLDFASKNLD